MKIILSSIFAMLFTISCHTQSCLPDGIWFSTQAEIDSFQVNYPNCTEIEGNVTIGDNFSGSITNLNGLSSLTSIGGQLVIVGNSTLTNLSGLDNLTTIGDSFWIGDPFYGGNESLNDITALNNLTHVGYGLGIWNNSSLSTLNGLESLIYTRHLNISQNSNINDISALSGLNSLDGELNIQANFDLVSLIGLQNISSIGGELLISNNTNLSNLDGLSGLNSVGGNLYIGKNHFLDNLHGLSGISSIGGSLTIEELGSLSSLSGIDSIQAGSISELIIRDNTLLSTCEVKSVCDYLAVPNGTIEIHDNAPGCNSQQEVMDACFIKVDDISFSKDYISILPNPTSKIVYIKLPDAQENSTTLKIYNINSQLLVSKKISGTEAVIDVSGLVPGIYFVHLIYEKTVMVTKFVRQ